MDERDLSASILKFSAKLIKELEKDKSYISSPLSVEFVLALLTLGSTDPGHSELLTALGIADDDALRTLFSHLTTTLKAVKGVTLCVANKVYVRRGLALDPVLQEDAATAFATETEEIDFADRAAAACRINKWTADKTRNRIQDVISADCLNADTQLILLNAIYFKGNWATPFQKEMTHECPFHVDGNTTIKVPMMSRPKGYYKYRRSKLGQILMLPYVGKETSMVFVLPRAEDNVDAIVDMLANGYDLVKELQSMVACYVIISIPKFKIVTTINLGDILPKLGIKSIFNPGVDKLSKNKQCLPVSHATQKAFIEVNEEGTEAAAATRIELQVCRQPPPECFIANRPFLYLVVSGSVSYPLFAGVYRGAGATAPTDPGTRHRKRRKTDMFWEYMIMKQLDMW